MKFPVLRFIHYCLWIVGIAGGILIFLSPLLFYLLGRISLPGAAFALSDVVRLLPNLLVAGVAGVVFALPLIALAELIELGLAIEDHLAASRQDDRQAVVLLERIASRSNRPAQTAPAAKPANPPVPAPAARPTAAAAKPAPVAQPAPQPAPQSQQPAAAAAAPLAAPDSAPEPPPALQPESAPPPEPHAVHEPAPEPQPESQPEPDADSEPEFILVIEVTAQNAFVFERPDVRSRYLNSAKPGRTFEVYGRDESGQWLSADLFGTTWIQSSHVKVNGDASALPVITPPPPPRG